MITALRGATVILGDRAVLRDLDLEVGPGVTVLRGPNGAGKTTALRALAGLVPLARGTCEVPFDLLYLGHRPQMLHGLTVRENLRFFTELRGRTSRAPAYSAALGVGGAREARIGGAIGRWGLSADADRPVERLSAGQRRRASLARLDTEWCGLTLLDEPFAELDDAAVALVHASLASARDRGDAVLVASHGHADLDEIAGRIYRIDDGRAA
ncbi:MAG: ATP-binding cassette domain-containing protein [Chloroflexi bacterium]|nr:ATP-binding cassette domain-containing protein [Chloroflexota bacterium]MBI2982737.1 ATP-binding cassette domain-containing protein [Chloroflexota bacterium]